MLFILLSFLNLITAEKKKEPFDALLRAVVLFMLYLFAVTEILSVFKLCRMPFLPVLWLIPDVLMAGWLLIKRRMAAGLRLIERSVRSALKNSCKQINILFLLFFLSVLLMALLTVPYNWDSITYHLTRMAIWAQNGSAAHFPTSDIRELSSPPLGEMVMLNLYILSGKRDIFLNLVQNFSYILNILIIYKISRRLGTDRKSAYFAAFAFLALPIAFAEALSTQVDEFAAVWLLIFVYFAIGFIMKDKLEINREQVAELIMMGLCTGFGYLAKPTVLPAMMITAFWLMLERIRRKNDTSVIIYMTIIEGLTAFLVVLPEIVRNILSFNAVTAPATGQRQLIGTLKPAYVFINTIKNIAYNLANPLIYSFSYRLQNIIYKISAFLNVDINAPEISEDGKNFEMSFSQIYDHDSATNGLLTVLIWIMFVTAIVLIIKNKGKKSLGIRYSFVSGLIYLFMCVIIRWEPFMNRYMLPVYAMCCPGIAICLENLNKRDVGRYIAVIALFLGALDLWGLMNYHSAIFYNQLKCGSRAESYYYKREDAFDEYMILEEYLQDRQPESVGIIYSGLAFRYPEWHLVNRENIKADSLIFEDGSLTGTGKSDYDIIVSIEYDIGDSPSFSDGHKYVPVKGDADGLRIFESSDDH